MTSETSRNSSFPYKWQLPVQSESEIDSQRRQLRILNSFTRRKELFVTKQKKIIKWYSCGPTVYDVSHLGHARCYITFDIIRRILADYFGYQIFYVMNITDIDDKIIKRARSNFLCDQFISNCLTADQSNQSQLIASIREAIDNYQSRRIDEKDPDKLCMVKKIIQKSEEALKKLPCDQAKLPDLLNELRDVIADEQDSKLAHTVTDHHIFKALTSRYEQEYHDDMQKLDVLPPSALTRVSEYIQEVGLYIKKLEENGFAYRAQDGSVYFDTNKFDADPKHSYAKLVREAYGHQGSLNEGEGELTTTQEIKKSPNDFALWKRSKSGEPSWVTQDYVPGRPGWHIECSVMASDLLGENFDIHSGGCDLKFPHHDNEIAQAEAYFNTGENWVNYFVHSGHLTISGCKMSKSLKNFITIRQALESYTSRQLRFAFLSHSWAETLDYSENTMNTAISYEKTYREYFFNVMDTIRRRHSKLTGSQFNASAKTSDHFQKWTPEDKELHRLFIESVTRVDSSLCDNLDTRAVLNILSSIVKECNKKPNTETMLLEEIASYVHNILSIFGTNFNEFKPEEIFGGNSTKDSESVSNNSQAVMKYIETLAQFRADVRRISKTGDDAKENIKQLLTLCDTLRDKVLPDIGIKLEDKEVDGRSFVVKLVDKVTMAQELAMAKRMDMEKKVKEEAAKLEKLKLKQQREDKMKINPCDMFKSLIDKYSAFDEKGIPTHDSDGKEISKSALKKLQRLYAEQEARYNKFIAEQH